MLSSQDSTNLKQAEEPILLDSAIIDGLIKKAKKLDITMTSSDFFS